MTDSELLDISYKFETKLKDNFGARGLAFGKRVRSIQHKLPKGLLRDLRSFISEIAVI